MVSDPLVCLQKQNRINETFYKRLQSGKGEIQMGIKTFLEQLFGKKSDSAQVQSTYEAQTKGNKGNGNQNGKKLVCIDCKSIFLFEDGEQKFFKMRGLTPPKRCPSCRKRKRRR